MSSAIGMGRIDLGALILITGAFSVPNTRPAAVAEQTGRLTWIFFVMFDESSRQVFLIKLMECSSSGFQ